MALRLSQSRHLLSKQTRKAATVAVRTSAVKLPVMAVVPMVAVVVVMVVVANAAKAPAVKPVRPVKALAVAVMAVPKAVPKAAMRVEVMEAALRVVQIHAMTAV